MAGGFNWSSQRLDGGGGMVNVGSQQQVVRRDIAARDGSQGTEEFAGDPVGKDDQHSLMHSRPGEEKGLFVSIAQIRITEPQRLRKDSGVQQSRRPTP